jgi:hypothetical protein
MRSFPSGPPLRGDKKAAQTDLRKKKRRNFR